MLKVLGRSSTYSSSDHPLCWKIAARHQWKLVEGADQILAVPKLPSGTGEACASAVYESVVAWGIKYQVKNECMHSSQTETGKRYDLACMSSPYFKNRY